jgi:hypothetical protein
VRKVISDRSNSETEALLLDFLEEMLPCDDIELFLEDNCIESFSIEMTKKDNDQQNNRQKTL